MQHRQQEELSKPPVKASWLASISDRKRSAEIKNKWDEWSFVFKRGIRSMNTNVYTAMHRVETQEAVLNEDIDQHPEMDQRSAELYDILCQHCAGDALRIVRGVADMHGLETW